MDVTIKDIFEAMPGRFQPTAAGEWKADIQFRFNTTEGEKPWFLSVASGACTVGEGELPTPSATIKTGAETWIGMVTGKVDPMQAFMSGQLRVEGNIGDVMKLQNPNLFKRPQAQPQAG